VLGFDWDPPAEGSTTANEAAKPDAESEPDPEIGPNVCPSIRQTGRLPDLESNLGAPAAKRAKVAATISASKEGEGEADLGASVAAAGGGVVASLGAEQQLVADTPAQFTCGKCETVVVSVMPHVARRWAERGCPSCKAPHRLKAAQEDGEEEDDEKLQEGEGWGGAEPASPVHPLKKAKAASRKARAGAAAEQGEAVPQACRSAHAFDAEAEQVGPSGRGRCCHAALPFTVTQGFSPCIRNRARQVVMSSWQRRLV
jgi:hypothetical protein